MPFTVTQTKLADVLILTPQVFSDARGYFFESFNTCDFAAATGASAHFVQDNHSRSAQGVLRGLHYQVQQPQGKLVRVIAGEIFDVVVDLRQSSSTFGHWTSATLSSDNRRQMWIPAGFAHGFLVLSSYAEVLYKTTDYWAVQHERALRWDDADLAINWPRTSWSERTQQTPVLSSKDAAAPTWAQALQAGDVFA